MSDFKKVFEVHSRYYIESEDEFLDEKLAVLGFTKDPDGWRPPLFPVASKQPLDPKKWHSIYKEEFRNKKDGSIKLFLSIPFTERVQSFYQKYTFSLLPKLYPNLQFSEAEKVYQIVLRTKIATHEDWLNFPFKEMSVFHFSEYNPAADFSHVKSLLKDIADKYTAGNLTQKDMEHLDSFLDEFGSYEDKRPNPNELMSSKTLSDEELIVGLNWPGFCFWELKHDIKGGTHLNKCEMCGNYIKGHIDKKMCGKQENPECYKEQQRIKKVKQRLRI